MESLRKYLTNKNLYIANIVSGSLMILMALICYSGVGNLSNSGSSWSDYASALSNSLSGLSFACILYYIDLLLVILLVIGWGLKIFYFKEKKEMTVIPFVISVVALLFEIYGVSTVSALSSVARMDFGGMLSSAYNLQNIESMKIPFIILFLAHISYLIVAILFMRMDKKGKSMDSTKFEQGTENLIKKLQAFAKDPKGKKTLIGIVSVCAVVVVGCVGFSLYNMFKKTPLDLVSDVQVTFSGYDGEGSATVEGTADYDHTNADITSFIYGVTYEVENNGELSNGDEVTITANYSKETANSLKLDITKASKTIEVEGLDEVYRTWDDLSKKDQKTVLDRAYDKVMKKAKDTTYQYFGKETITVNSLNQIAAYYTYAKGSGEGSLKLIYKADITSTNDGDTVNHVEYYMATASGLKPTKDGIGKISVDVSYLYSQDDSEQEAIEDAEDYRVDAEDKIDIEE